MFYTKEMDEFLKENVKGISLKDLTAKFNEQFNLNKDEQSIANRKFRLGLHSGVNIGQYSKGRSPTNKGKKWSEYMSEEGQKKSLQTCFKKGNVPHNCVKVGSEALVKGGFVKVKIAEPNKRKLKQRLIYEQHYGEIPKGYVVTFLNGDKHDFRIENLMLISQAENLRLNNRKIRTADEELTKASIGLIRLENKIGEIENETTKHNS